MLYGRIFEITGLEGHSISTKAVILDATKNNDSAIMPLCQSINGTDRPSTKCSGDVFKFATHVCKLFLLFSDSLGNPSCDRSLTLYILQINTNLKIVLHTLL